jgi:uncharacterized membrane protein YgdD (TMEM256/DUF423 family)
MIGSKWLVFCGAVFAAIAVGLGAIGAHALPDYLASQAPAVDSAPRPEDMVSNIATIQKKLDNYEKAVRYQLYHSLAILMIGFSTVSSRYRGFRIAAIWMIAGILLFCGGIYGIVFTPYPTHWIVPLGGLSFILGWIVLAVSVCGVSPANSDRET